MGKLRIALALLLVVLVASGGALAAGKRSGGVGWGSMYNGLGGNYASMNETNVKYVAVGCSGASHSSDETNVICGVGVGWIWSQVFTRKNNRHGLGVNLALDYDSQFSDLEPVLRVPYVYFFKGSHSKGLNLGVAPEVRWGSSDTEAGVMIQIGYQF